MNSLELDKLIKRFDMIMSICQEDIPRPTKNSIDNINKHFGITLPKSLIYFAINSKFFGTWFASLGDNYTYPHHIIRINSYWRRRRRTRRIPRNLIIINIGHDEDLDCMDKNSRNSETGEYTIRYWCPEVNDEYQNNEYQYTDFFDYIKRCVNYWESLRTKSKRI